MKKNSKRKKNDEGFTFVETLAVLAIGAVLTAGATISVSKIMGNARHYAAVETISQYKAALQSYYIDCGNFPTSQQGLQALWNKPVLYPVPEGWKGPYIDKEISRDPWGFNYVYVRNDSSAFPVGCPSGLPYAIMSFGADGKQGGEGEGSDITSWK